MINEKALRRMNDLGLVREDDPRLKPSFVLTGLIPLESLPKAHLHPPKPKPRPKPKPKGK